MERDAAEAREQERAVDENIHAIKIWERAALDHRSPIEHASETITRVAGNGVVLVLHICWYLFWIAANLGLLGFKPFDPFPFPLLTSVVSLEAIFLTLFVLASQNRLTGHSDKRAQLDLQINLLAEREMTAVLVLLHDISRHLKVPTSLTAEQLRDLAGKTDIEQLTNKVEQLPKD